MKRRILLIVVLFVVSVLLLAAQKLAFLSYYHNLLAPYGWQGLWDVLYNALLSDGPIAIVLLAWPTTIVLCSFWIDLSTRFWRWLIYGGLVVFSVLSATAFAVDLGLYDDWGFKLSVLACSYLTDWRELLTTLNTGESGVIMCFAIADLLLMLAAYYLALWRVDFKPVAMRLRAIGTGLMVAILGFSIGISCNLCSINLTSESASQRTFVDHAAINPLTSLLRSVTRGRCFENFGRFYAETERNALFQTIQSVANQPRQQVLNSKRPNIAIIICESFSRSIMDMMSEDRAIMPNMQRIRHEGIWFENMYANSFRTDRGLVAVLNGFPAQPNHTLLRMQSKTIHLNSLARTLAAYGYESSVLYGGNLNFTQMAAYFRSTRWQNICSQRNLTDLDVTPSKWGYDDATMGRLFVRQLCENVKNKEPFIATWLTLSSHAPYDVPEHRFKNKLFDAMAFSDAAVGQVVDSLKASPVWDNLLLILVADHATAYPQQSAYDSPLRHHIPMIWTGGAIKHTLTIDNYLSQTDLAATLLGQMEIDNCDFPFSRDCFATKSSDTFAYYTFLDGFGIVDNDGYTLYDVSTHTTRKTQGRDPNQRIEQGKTILQSTYHAMDNLH